jgi:hypothetical protein
MYSTWGMWIFKKERQGFVGVGERKTGSFLVLKVSIWAKKD